MKKVFLFSFVLLLITIMAMPVSSLAKDPIKIGFFAPLTGFAAQTGKDMLSGLKFYLEQQNYKVAGRSIVLLMDDTEGKPAVAMTKVRRLVERDGVHVLIGGLMASTGYALKPYVDRKKIPAVYAVMASDDLTQREQGKWMFEPAGPVASPLIPLENMPIKHWDSVKL